MSAKPTKSIIKYALFQSLLYTSTVAILAVVAREFSLELRLYHAIDACKIISLAAVLLVGGEIWESYRGLNHNDNQRHLRLFKRANGLILTVTLIVILLLVIKLTVFSLPILFDPNSISDFGSELKYKLSQFMIYVSMFPIFAYTLLNAVIAFYSPKEIDLPIKTRQLNEKNRGRALQFFVYSNLTVAIPLLLVVILVNTPNFSPDSYADRDVFLSGAIAVTLLVSAIAAKAVEAYNS